MTDAETAQPTQLLNLPPKLALEKIPAGKLGQPGRGPWIDDRAARELALLTATRDILTVARRLLDGGWTQGMSHRLPDPPPGLVCYCASGAVQGVVFGIDSFPGVLASRARYEAAQDLYNAAIDYLHLSLRPVRTLSSWNDEAGRQKAEVLDLFDRAIVKIDEKRAALTPDEETSDA